MCLDEETDDVNAQQARNLLLLRTQTVQVKLDTEGEGHDHARL